MKDAAHSNDREILNNILSSQNIMTSRYNFCVNDSTTASVRDQFLNLLSEEHEMLSDILSELQKRQWYQPEKAEEAEIALVKSRYGHQ